MNKIKLKLTQKLYIPVWFIENTNYDKNKDIVLATDTCKTKFRIV